MKIGFVGDHWGRGGGTRGQMRSAAEGLARLGHEVDVHVISAEDGRVPRVRVLPLLGDSAQARAQFVRGLRGYDIVHSWIRVPSPGVFRAGGGAHAAWLRARDGRRGLRRHIDPRDRRELLLDRACCEQASVVICNSQMGARDIAQAYGVSSDKLRVIRNGVDLDGFKAHARGVDLPVCEGRVAVFVGRGVRRKGLHTAATAFLRIAKPIDQLWVVGEDRLRTKREITRLVGAQLRWLGARSDVAAVLAGAHALVLPTRYDSSANVVLEGLACGLPTVTTAYDGAAEVVPDRRLVVPDPHDAHAVADALGYAWSVNSDPRWRAAAECWPVSRMVGALEALYTECRND